MFQNYLLRKITGYSLQNTILGYYVALYCTVPLHTHIAGNSEVQLMCLCWWYTLDIYYLLTSLVCAGMCTEQKWTWRCT